MPVTVATMVVFTIFYHLPSSHSVYHPTNIYVSENLEAQFESVN